MDLRALVLTITFVAAPLTACKHPGSQKLEGRWRGQRADGVPEAAQVSANTFATSTEIIAQGDQIVIQTPAGRSPGARYTIDKEDEATLVIHTDRDDLPETFTFDERSGTMVWRIDDGRSMTFKKVP